MENQERAATRELTGSFGEQSRLETLLEASKPAWLPGAGRLHWLLRSPFRYPPLAHGSRFGSRHQPGVFYGSREVETALTESAVYLWLFRAGPRDTGPLAVLRDSRTALDTAVEHPRTVDLTTPAHAAARARISDPASYAYSQALGNELRRSEVGVAWFWSARREGGINTAVFDPAALPAGEPPRQVQWQFRLDGTSCWWDSAEHPGIEIEYAAVSQGGTIPHPAL